MASYSSLDKFLHKLALQSSWTAEVQFDIDQMMAKFDIDQVREQKHVFVSGLARAGTTILMRRFHDTGNYYSLQYHDMPFVLAPNIWHRLSSYSAKKTDEVERVHGDGIKVDVDSPESLDEVFWRAFAGKDYIFEQHLGPHDADDELTEKFIRYVAAILCSKAKRGQTDVGQHRYLSKNNNNILRLKSVRKAFANALIIVPFRNPVAHAQSLLRIHNTFSDMQASDPFMAQYMVWLAHHEFGLDHRPFRFETDQTTLQYAPDQIEYWIQLWCNVYLWLENSAPADVLFIAYESLCADPAYWERLTELAEVDASGAELEELYVSPPPEIDIADKELVAQGEAIYQRLVERSKTTLW